LKLKYDKLVPSFGFSFNLRRCIEAEGEMLYSEKMNPSLLDHLVRRCRFRGFRVKG
jgi:hypothetical protein